jgi:ethanolamine utilization protein EutA
MSARVLLVGLDFGTTTSCAVVASAAVVCNSVTGRMELSQVEQVYQSDQVFTPLVDDRLDEARLAAYLDSWLARVDRACLFGGGVVITGLAAQKANAAAFVRQTRRYLKDALIAVGEDPCLESWLAFMGNCVDLSKAHPQRMFLNLDIGGGTTNLAAGRSGEVLRTGSVFVGARHVQLVPGGYQIVRLSSYALALFEHLGIHKGVGDHLTESDVQTIVKWYLALLQTAVCGTGDLSADPLAAMHWQVPFHLPAEPKELAITLSGGVGQLVYSHLQGAAWPATTAFGDLGIDLAKGLAESSFWRARLQAFRPTTLGRATVYGLLRYNTQVSGSTLYLSDPKLLPLGDLVILGTIGTHTLADEMERLLVLANRTAHGACLRIELSDDDLAALRSLATTMQQSLARLSSTARVPLVLLLRKNLGKVFGQYLTNWGASPVPLVVIDEIDARDVQFAHLGFLREGVVPVSFYGMTPPGESS